MTETCSAVLRSRRNCSSDGAERTDDGRAFHARAAVAGKARSPSVVRRVAGVIERQLCWPAVVGVNRRISCKDLGGGDCQGWLWKKRDGSGLMAGRWVKYWFVLHSSNLFYYKDPEVGRHVTA